MIELRGIGVLRRLADNGRQAISPTVEVRKQLKIGAVVVSGYLLLHRLNHLAE